MTRYIALILLLLMFPVLTGASDLGTRKTVSLMNIVRTTTSTSYTFTGDRNGIWLYDANEYDATVTGVTIRGIGRVAGAGDVGYMELYDITDAASVAGSEITFTATTNAEDESGDIEAQLEDDHQYRLRFKCDNGAGGAPSGNCSLDTFNVRIQIAGQPTALETVIELSEDNNVPSATYAAPADYAIFEYDADAWDGTIEAYIEADLHLNSGGDTMLAQFYDLTAGAAVAGSEVSHTGDTTTTRKRSGAITLVDGHEYRPDVDGGTTSDDLVAFKVIIQQAGTLTKTQNYVISLNTITSGASTAYTAQNRSFTFSLSDFAGDTTDYYHESTLKSSNGNLAYSQLYNVTDASSANENTTTSASYDRVRSGSLDMSTHTGDSLDHRRKQDTSGTVSVARAFLVTNQTWSAGAVAGTPGIPTFFQMGDSFFGADAFSQ